MGGQQNKSSLAPQETTEEPDPLEGRTLSILNGILAAVHPGALAGDGPSIDRVLKIIDLKMRYKDRRTPDDRRWRM